MLPILIASFFVPLASVVPIAPKPTTPVLPPSKYKPLSLLVLILTIAEAPSPSKPPSNLATSVASLTNISALACNLVVAPPFIAKGLFEPIPTLQLTK